jgi:hypothetical protein
VLVLARADDAPSKHVFAIDCRKVVVEHLLLGVLRVGESSALEDVTNSRFAASGASGSSMWVPMLVADLIICQLAAWPASRLELYAASLGYVLGYSQRLDWPFVSGCGLKTETLPRRLSRGSVWS